MEQTKYYYIPKERIINLLDRPANFNGDGTVTMIMARDHLDTRSSIFKATISDFLISSNIVATPLYTQFIGKMGTKIVIWGYDGKCFSMAKEEVDIILKEYEL